jgi:protein SCO1
VLVDADGRQRVGFPFDQLTPEALAHDIRRLADEA